MTSKLLFGGAAMHGERRRANESKIWQRHFLASLKRDLRAAGFNLLRSSNGMPFEVLPPDNGLQLSYMHRLREQQIMSASSFISRMEAIGILVQFGRGSQIRLESIQPKIQFCESRADHEVFRYCKLFHRIPTTNRVGRQLRALVYDVGQDRPLLMGAFELASGAYTLGCRDVYLNWNDPSKTHVKQMGLRRTMDLASVIALPPYNFLLGGKLVAALALSDVVLAEFRRRYKSPLLGLVATSATGLHCAILNRIGLKPGGLYRRIGATAGYSTIFASAQTLSHARGCLENFVSAPKGEFSVSVRPLYVLREALEACGFAPERILRSAYAKGVYFGAVSDGCVRALRSGRGRRIPHLSVDAILTYWRERYLQKAVTKPTQLTHFISYEPHGPLALTNSGDSACSG